MALDVDGGTFVQMRRLLFVLDKLSGHRSIHSAQFLVSLVCFHTVSVMLWVPTFTCRLPQKWIKFNGKIIAIVIASHSTLLTLTVIDLM